MGGTRKLLRGHYNPVNKSRKYANIQWATVDGQRKRFCTTCIRTLAKKPVVRAKKTVAVAAK